MLNRRTERGFTLIEIMVVMVIIGLLVALVAPNIMGRGDQARVTTAKAQMRQISSALDMYRLDNSHYPSTQQGLEALVERPSGNPRTKQLEPGRLYELRPQDPWGNEYEYVSPGSEGAYDLYSLGADGREGGEGVNADISVWDLQD